MPQRNLVKSITKHCFDDRAGNGKSIVISPDLISF